jgi:hypothetical protein
VRSPKRRDFGDPATHFGDDVITAEAGVCVRKPRQWDTFWNAADVPCRTIALVGIALEFVAESERGLRSEHRVRSPRPGRRPPAPTGGRLVRQSPGHPLDDDRHGTTDGIAHGRMRLSEADQIVKFGVARVLRLDLHLDSDGLIACRHVAKR